MAIKEAKDDKDYPVEVSCAVLGVSRAAYDRWLSGRECARERENEKIAELVHAANPDKGYRRVKDDLAHDHKLNMTEFKWYDGITVRKVYLSAILDLYDSRIIVYIIRDRNDTSLGFDTLDAA